MNALETFLTTADPKPIVWVLNIDVGDGLRTTVHATPDSADAELRSFVRENWTEAYEYDETLPDDFEDCEDPVDAYFEAVGWERTSYNIDGVTLNS